MLSCDEDDAEICTNENACNYGENAECYYFVPTDIAVDADEYHCGDIQVLQDIIDINENQNIAITIVSRRLTSLIANSS